MPHSLSARSSMRSDACSRGWPLAGRRVLPAILVVPVHVNVPRPSRRKQLHSDGVLGGQGDAAQRSR
jgi:hypothetical protein